MSQRDGGVNRQHSLETGLSQAIRPMLICASESSVSVKNQQGSDQLSVPQTQESRMAKMKKKIASPLLKRRNQSGGVTVMTNKTFGVSVDELLRRSEGCEVPPIIKSIVEYLAKHGMSHEGIFRISGNHKVVESLKATYDKVGEANLEEVGDVMAVAGLLKLFLRELPDPPIPQSMTADFIKVHQAHKDDRGGLSEIKALLEKLPASNYQLLKYLCNFLVKVSMNEENNKMSSMALAIVFGPNFFRCGDGIEGLREQGHTNAIVCTFIEEFDTLFEVSPYATTDIYRVQEANTNDSPTLLARKKHLQKAGNEKNESSASDEETLHLTRQKDKEKIQEDGPTYATVKKPKKMLHIPSPTEDLDMYMRSVSPSWNTHQSDSSPTLESPKPPAGKEIVQKVINDTIKEHLFGPDLTSTDENSPHSPESGDEGPPLPNCNYSEEDTGKQRRRRRRNGKTQKETSDINDTVENSSKGKMSVKEAVEELETIESGGQDNRQLEKENLVKPLKKRPKSEGFELFEKKGIVIGVDKNSNHILSSTYPQKSDSQDQFERFKNDKDSCEEIISTSSGDLLFRVKRNSEVLGSLTRDRAPPPKNRRRPSLKKRHETSEIFTNSEEELDKGRNRLSSSQGCLDIQNESTVDKSHEPQNIRKWTYQENIMRDSGSSNALGKSVQEISDLSLIDDYSNKKNNVDDKCSSKVTKDRGSPGNISSTPSRKGSSSTDLRNDYLIKSNHTSENLSKPWETKDGLSNEVTRKSSLDSEPVREKGSPRTKPRDSCFLPERDSSIQSCDVKSRKDLLWSPASNAHKFEIPVDLAILEATPPTVSSPLSSVGGIDLPHGGVDGTILSPVFPLSPGSLKDFKPSNYFTHVTFKCGEMEPERDTNCLPRRSSSDSIEGVCSDTVTNRRDASDNYVKRFERKILRSTGDIENEDSLLSSANGIVEGLNCRDAKTAGYPNINIDTRGNPGLGSGSSSAINSSAGLSTNQGSSATILASDDSQSPRTQSKSDPIVRSKHPSDDSPSLKDNASPSRNPASLMTLRKLVSNPIPQKQNNSQTRTSRPKRNSLPTSQPIDLLGNPDSSKLPGSSPLPKSSSQTNLSPSQKEVHKSSSQNNLSVRQTASDFSRNFLGEGSFLDRRKNNGHVGKNNPHSKAVSTNNPHTKGNDIKSSSANTNPANPHLSNERQGTKERSRESNLHSSNLHYQANKTTSSTSSMSASSPLRYPYTRRGSTPAKGSPTIKPPPKAASNPTSPLYPNVPKEHIEFFGAAGATYPGNPSGSTNARDPKREHKELREGQDNPKTGQRCQSREGRSCLANPSGKDSKSSLSSVLRTEYQFSEHLSSVDTPGDSDVLYVPSSAETSSKSRATSGKTNKRFPSSSSSDSGLNMSDPDETQKHSHSPSPTSPKFPIGTSIFYDPREQQNPFTSSEKRPSVAVTDPANVAILSRSVQPDNVSNPFQTSSAKSDGSPNKMAPSDSDNFKNLKNDVSKITDKRSVDSSECCNSRSEKCREVPSAVKLAALAHTGNSTSKEFAAASTLPPDISGRASSKSPPSSSKVDSKELLGQLVKKVLNSAAAKQGSSPKASFAEAAISAAKEGDKGKSPQGKMFFFPDERTETVEKETPSRQGQRPTGRSSKHKPRLSDSDKASRKKDQGLLDSKESTTVRDLEEATSTLSPRSFPVVDIETTISPSNSSKDESSSPEVLSSSLSSSEEKGVFSKIMDMIHDEFAFDGYMDDGVEDVNMAEYVLSLGAMSEEKFKEAITDQYSDLYWDEDLLHDMYEAVTGGEQSRSPTLQFSESTVSDISPPESINLSREESYLSLEPLYFNSISRSSSERSGTGAKDILMSPLGEATEFLPIKVIAPEMQAGIQELLTPIFEDYLRVMEVKLATSVEDLMEKLGTKIMEISQQLMLERRAKKKSMNSYNKMADVENKKDVKDLASKLVNEIEECDKKIIYLKNVQRQLRDVYAERFGIDTSLLYSFLVSYNKSSVALVPELNNTFLTFSPIWNQRLNESTDIVDESLTGPSLQSGTKLGLFSYLFDRHAMSQAYVRYFLYTFRYVTTAQELFSFIREKCSASLRTDSSGQVYNHQLQIRYRALDLLSEWIDGYYQFDFKTNPNLIKELLAFVKDELILVDRSERGHYLMELIAEKQKRDLNNNSVSDEPSDFVAVLQLEDPQGLNSVDDKKDSPRKPMGSRKSKSPVQCFRRATPEKSMTYKPTLYLKALSVLDHSSRILAEQLTLIQQDLFFHIHPVNFLNSRAHGIGVGRTQSPTRERDSIFGFSTGSRRVKEQPGSSGEVPIPWEQNMYVSEPSTDGHLEHLLEHAQDVSLWVAVEICSASSIKAQLALITKFLNAARYCCEIRNYSTCIQIVDALEMFVIRQLPVWRQVPTKTTEALEELKAVKVLLKTDSSWLMKSEASRDKPTIPCFLLFVIHVQQQELGGFTLPNDMFKWTKMRSAARLVDQIRLFKQMRYAFQTDDELKDRLKQRIQECKKENLHALASENASNFHLSSSHGSRKFHDAFKKMKATFGSHN